MALTEQDYIDIENQIDGLDFEQITACEEYDENTSDSAGEKMKWFIRKLRGWYES